MSSSDLGRLTPGVEIALAAHNLLDRGHGEFTPVATRSELGRSLLLQLRARFF